MRTKRVVELLSDAITSQEPTLAERAPALAEETLTAAGIKIVKSRKEKDGALAESGYLLFLSNRQVANLAELAVTAARAAGEGKVNVSKAEARARANSEHSVDVALFGRMVADVTDLNVDAACQVAHALSVHGVASEYDYFTAVDDHKQADVDEDAGAGMIGTVEFNSSTLYRYATVDVDRLQDNLGHAKATCRAVEAFARAFITSMPTGKQNTFANRTLPDAVLVVVRDTQPISLVGAYEQAITDNEPAGRIGCAIRRLVDHGRDLHQAFDQNPVAAWAIGVGDRAAPLGEIAERTTLDGTISALGSLLTQRVADPS